MDTTEANLILFARNFMKQRMRDWHSQGGQQYYYGEVSGRTKRQTLHGKRTLGTR